MLFISSTDKNCTFADFQLHSASMYDFAVIGGGAAGVFGAVSFAEMAPGSKVAVFERSGKLLTKVKISGGGRCNVTHACWDPSELVKHYPRGSRELLGAFHRFQPRDMIAWLAERNVALFTQPDGRMFPVSDDSQTIIDCFVDQARKLNVELYTYRGVEQITHSDGSFLLTLSDGSTAIAKKILIATGGGSASGGIQLAKSLGHTITPIAPSLFTFNVSDPRIEGLAGISSQDAIVYVSKKRIQRGPLLITHRGLSGPAVLRLSAWEARELQSMNYQFTLVINWTACDPSVIEDTLEKVRNTSARKSPMNTPVANISSRLWERLVASADISAETTWSQMKRSQIQALLGQLTAGEFQVSGKNTNKDEFVTCGGVNLREVDFKTFESRICKGLYFAGEVLDIDGITGGFNFQAAWTGARLAASAASQNTVS